MCLISAALTAQATLVCEKPAFDFGTLAETEVSVSHTFEVRNAGSEPIVVTEVRSSCDCLAATVTHNLLLPGECVPVDARFSFGNRSGPQSRVFHLAYRLANEPPTVEPQVLSLSMTGTILAPVLRYPDRVDLGTVLPGSIATGSLRLVSGRCGPFALLASNVAASGPQTDYATGITATNHQVRLLIPAPPRNGQFTGFALATTDLVEMTQVPIRYAGRVAPFIEARPSLLTVQAEQPFLVKLVVDSPYHIPFRVISAETSDPRVSVSLAAQDGYAAHLTVTAGMHTGNLSGTLLRLTTDHPVCRVIEIPIRSAPSALTHSAQKGENHE